MVTGERVRSRLVMVAWYSVALPREASSPQCTISALHVGCMSRV